MNIFQSGLWFHLSKITLVLEDCSFSQLIGTTLNLQLFKSDQLDFQWWEKYGDEDLALDALLAESLSICCVNLKNCKNPRNAIFLLSRWRRVEIYLFLPLFSLVSLFSLFSSFSFSFSPFYYILSPFLFFSLFVHIFYFSLSNPF